MDPSLDIIEIVVAVLAAIRETFLLFLNPFAASQAGSSKSIN